VFRQEGQPERITVAPHPVVSNTAPSLLVGLGIVVPALEERCEILTAIDAATAAARRFAVMREIVVVVDGGGRDDTAAAVTRLNRADVVLVRRATRLGYDAAACSGLRATTMPWALLPDDGSEPDFRELAALVPLTDDADLLAGRTFRLIRVRPKSQTAP
jgi:glycosyltransferase involved in cell wall biosynthesis